MLWNRYIWECAPSGKLPFLAVRLRKRRSAPVKKPKKNEHLIPVQVWRIYPYPEVTPQENFLVVLKGEDEKFVPVSIGAPEGQYLVMAMQKMSFPRPLTQAAALDLDGLLAARGMRCDSRRRHLRFRGWRQ